MKEMKLPAVSSTPHANHSGLGRKRASFVQWFDNLPVKSKQLTGLFTSEVISVVGLIGVSAILIVAGGRSQLRQQAESELAVTKINYNIKIDQMGFNFRSQSDNPAIIAAAVAYDSNQPLPEPLTNQVRQILKNEIEAQNIEYATLVGKDKRIIVNANTERIGETFDPNNLVSKVIETSEQIKVSQIVSWEELRKESPPLPEGFSEEDALIRYTLTPVSSPQTGDVIAVLVSGDIINDKKPIVEKTLKAFDGGYSAIYTNQQTGELSLATSLEQGKGENLEQAQSNVTLADTSVLKKAIDNPDEVVTSRQTIGEQTYTVAAQALRDFSGEPAVVLVRGTSEAALNTLLGNSLLLQMLISVIALSADVFLAILLGRSIAGPIKKLDQTTQRFANGDRQIRAEVTATDEVGQLAGTFNYLADNIVSGERMLAQQSLRQQKETERAQFFAEFTGNIYKSLKVEAIFNSPLEGLRSILQADRVVIYRLNSERNGGVITTEALERGWVKAKGESNLETALWEGDIISYRNGRVWVCNNLEEVGLNTKQLRVLDRLQVKANMVAPILQDDEPVAFLCVHQCSGIRLWQHEEVLFIKQLAAQIGLALKQANLIAQLKLARQEAESERQKALALAEVERAHQAAEFASIEQRHQKEELQRQVMQLLSAIEESAKGDLTVRADVTETEIGTVADFFNSIIENQREIVMQVKEAVTKVNSSLQNDEQSMEQLSTHALQQTEEINRSLDSVVAMGYSIQSVAESARQAAEIARIASAEANVGGIAIDGTVENIVKLREKVIETADKVKLLGKSSQQIARVVSLVQQVSVKTNLLSINAGIEANRAGEEGEGFRVIAAQIGELATQSVNATNEIEKAIETIQLGTRDVAEAMEEGRTQVVEGSRLVVDAKKSIEKIVEVSRQIDDLVQSISSETVSQTQTSQEVTELMQEIATTSQITSQASSQFCSNLRETVEVAEKLQTSVGRFKI